MRCPFPGMDPYLEQPELWPDVHNRLIMAIADMVAPLIAPRYYTRLQRRTYLLRQDALDLVGLTDIAVLTRRKDEVRPPRAPAGLGVVEVEVPIVDEVAESYLEIRSGKGLVDTTVEILSPVNKLDPRGRRDYETKRNQVFASLTNLVEIDLLRAGEPMPVIGANVRSDYRILLRRGFDRPRAHLYAFGIRDAVPAFPLPLLPGDDEPLVDLNDILHAVYDRARFDMELDYTQPPAPPFAGDDAAWAHELLAV